MKIVKKILSSVLYGGFGFALSLCVAPIAALAIIGYMTKVSFEIGYQDDPNETVKRFEKDVEKITE